MKRHLRHILYLGIWTFTIVVVWIVFLILVRGSEPVVSEETLKHAEEIEPQLDNSALESLRSRDQIPVDLNESFLGPVTVPVGTESGVTEELSEPVGTEETETGVTDELPEDLE